MTFNTETRHRIGWRKNNRSRLASSSMETCAGVRAVFRDTASIFLVLSPFVSLSLWSWLANTDHYLCFKDLLLTLKILWISMMSIDAHQTQRKMQ
ncbi:hypothetical protein CKK84_04035 [Salmonella enterica]|nr:hypothetical protein [Salmonella enterica]EDU8060525.1 hypothetical protein [Salmonella enterica subsp. enterica serovar Oranienburg]EBD5386986.1 hypothetical protein [Salmonella enterica]EBE4533134.1 hypothetical protein [Salmonella enterica]EBH6095228.1 hypothetical protein [Salmonella enterica]